MTTYLLVALGIAVAVREAVSERYKESPKWRISGALLGIAIAILGGYGQWSSDREQQSRDFRDASATRISADPHGGQLAAVFAGSGMVINPQGGPVNLGNAGDIIAEIEPSNGTLVVDATLRDETGTAIAGIRRNEIWWSDDSRFDRNYSDVSFELFDRQLDLPRIQVKLIGHVAVINGIFFTADGIPVVYTPTVHVVAPSSPERMSEIRNTLCPWFRYPAVLHPGEMTEECVNRSTGALDNFYAVHPEAKILLERGKPYTYEEFLAATEDKASTRH